MLITVMSIADDSAGSEPPLYPSALLGWRNWRPRDQGRLYSLGFGHTTWGRGINQFRCRRHPDAHALPQGSCECGFYAYHEVTPLLVGSSVVLGAVLGAGATEIHRDGWRAERAQLIAIYSPRSWDFWDPFLAFRLQESAERYGVPIFEDIRELRQYAESLGAPAPLELRPGRPRRWIPHADHLRLYFLRWMALVGSLALVASLCCIAVSLIGGGGFTPRALIAVGVGAGTLLGAAGLLLGFRFARRQWRWWRIIKRGWPEERVPAGGRRAPGRSAVESVGGE